MPRPREFDETAVITAAMKQFWHRGYEATSLDDLERATGLKRGSLYGAFTDKQALFRKALDAYRQNASQYMTAVFDPKLSAIRQLENVLERWFKVTTSPDFHGCMMANVVSELAGQDGEAVAAVRETWAQLERLILTTLKVAKSDGDLPKNANPRRLARSLVATFQGVLILGKGGVAHAVIRDALDQSREMLGLT